MADESRKRELEMKKSALSQRWLDEFWTAIGDDSTAFLRTTAKRSKGYHFLVDQVYSYLNDYVPRGRGLGSAFILASYRGYKGSGWSEIIRVATAFELLSKAVLIIDDIVDCDSTRMGFDSFDTELKSYAAARGWKNQERFGQSAGIFGAQLLTSLAHLALVSADISDRKLRQVEAILFEAMKALEESQLADLAFEHLFPTKKEWFQMARLRAATHISTALRIGAVLAGQCASVKMELAQAGAHLGYMFDIRADLLDGFGPPSKKSIRKRDLRMRKKSLFICIALESAPAGEQERLRKLLSARGRPSNHILEIAARWGVPPALQQLRKRKAHALRLIRASRLTPDGKQFFQEIIARAGAPPPLELQGGG